ncbi:JmjC domain-containing protein [Abeliophyllum distichum]|uniref:JmjC domain-containing protein n=1 Tax=Abeliophyllum distichum TaxID=126358 RepID=A0ABD1PST6_9LAMI
MANLVHSCGWQRVTGKPHLAYPLLVKEFFANFNHSIEDPATDHQYTTWVRGQWIQFSPAVIAHYYELPALDFEPIPADFDMTQVAQFLYGRADAWPLAGPKFLHNQLTESLRIFHIFVCHNIDPTSHRTDFKESRAQFLYHLASGHRIDLGEHIFRFIVDLASQYASGRSPMFPCLISALCLAGGVPLLPHEEPENHEPPITKRTLGNPVARRAADNPAPPPAAETDRLLRQMFTQLSEQGRVLNSIQRTQLAMQRTVDHMRIEIDSLNGLSISHTTMSTTACSSLRSAWMIFIPSSLSPRPRALNTMGPLLLIHPITHDLLLHTYTREVPDLFFLSFCSNLLTLGTMQYFCLGVGKVSGT